MCFTKYNFWQWKVENLYGDREKYGEEDGKNIHSKVKLTSKPAKKNIQKN